MKKIIAAILLSVFSIHSAQAKKVKFAVDMSGQVISAYGIHVTGDFQTLAGYAGGDWTANTTMTQETTDTNIYSVVVDIPAFTKYEYKFMNGDQFYEAEFVPIESRVGYNFNDNRWIYIDSTANDTTFIGALLFGGNAPKGKKLARIYVDMQNETVSANRVHVYGDFQLQNPYSVSLYNFDAAVHEVIVYVDSLSTYEYKFYNGNLLTETETVPGTCAVNGSRVYTAAKDSMFSAVCFSSCSLCVPNGIAFSETGNGSLHLYPNPTTGTSTLHFENFEEGMMTVNLADLSGRTIYSLCINGSADIQLSRNELRAGIYLLQVKSKSGGVTQVKWIVE